MTDLPHAEAPVTDQWELHVDIDFTDDPERQFPFDDVSRFIAFLGDKWFLIPEDLTEIVKWNDTGCIRISAEVLDQLVEPLHWLCMHTIPTRILLIPGGASDDGTYSD
jgi:hypothetical protein